MKTNILGFTATPPILKMMFTVSSDPLLSSFNIIFVKSSRHLSYAYILISALINFSFIDPMCT